MLLLHLLLHPALLYLRFYLLLLGEHRLKQRDGRVAEVLGVRRYQAGEQDRWAYENKAFHSLFQ